VSKKHYVGLLCVFVFLFFWSYSYMEQEKELGVLREQIAELKQVQADLLESKTVLEGSIVELTDKHTAEKEYKQSLIARLEERVKSLLSENQHLRRRVPRVSSSHTTPPGERVAFLTFDDGPSRNTVRILDTLRDKNVRATFFVNGRSNDFGRYVYRRIVNEGHSIGNHTYSHQFRHIYYSVSNFREDVLRVQNLVRSATGVEMDIFRFPGGSNNGFGGSRMPLFAREVVELGFQYFDWNVDSADASAVTLGRDKIIRSVLEGSRNRSRAVILMHDAGTKTTTADALPYIISGLRDMGFRFEILTRYTAPIRFIQPAG